MIQKSVRNFNLMPSWSLPIFGIFDTESRGRISMKCAIADLGTSIVR